MRREYPFSWRAQSLTPMSRAFLDRITADQDEDTHHFCKLTTAQAKQIRADYAAGVASQAELAERFNVGSTLVYKIIHNRAYTEGR